MTANPYEPQYTLARFWPRFGAYFLDGLIIGSFVLLFNYINFTQLQSFALYLPVTIIGILYKPYMEYKYAATLGKMAFKIKVTDYSLKKISFKQSMLRSLILFIPTLLYIPIYYLAFNNPNVNSTDFNGFNQQITESYPTFFWITSLTYVISLTDLVVYLIDSEKQKRSLHDRIGETLVIKNE